MLVNVQCTHLAFMQFLSAAIILFDRVPKYLFDLVHPSHLWREYLEKETAWPLLQPIFHPSTLLTPRPPVSPAPDNLAALSLFQILYVIQRKVKFLLNRLIYCVPNTAGNFLQIPLSLSLSEYLYLYRSIYIYIYTNTHCSITYWFSSIDLQGGFFVCDSMSVSLSASIWPQMFSSVCVNCFLLYWIDLLRMLMWEMIVLRNPCFVSSIW